MMSTERAVKGVGGLVWKGGAILVALPLLTAMIADFQNGSRTASPRDASHSDEADQPIRRKRVKLELVPVGVSHCILERATGEELLEVEYAHDESVGVRFGSAFPVQLRCIATPDGGYHLNVRHRDAVYRLRIRPDGVSGFTVTRLDVYATKGVGLTDADEFVNNPSLIE